MHERTASTMRLLLCVAIVLVHATASAEVLWQFTKEHGRPLLQAMPDEPESDKVFWALCRAGGAIDIGIGADTTVGTGEGEPVTLTFAGAGMGATVAGMSGNSANFQMTAGTKLRASISRDHALFRVLATDKPIAVSGASKPMILLAKGRKAKVAAFLKACK
jgi:hypothetical protein